MTTAAMPPAPRSDDWSTFIRANTQLASPPLVPEIRLHLAAESLPIWQRTEEELGAMNLPPPYWAFAWAGGQALARYLLDRPSLAAGRSVLDLGAGSGLCAIAAAKAGARKVVAADVDPVALVAIAVNAAANATRIEITSDDLLSALPPACDLVIVGDLFYERELAGRVLHFIDSAARQGIDVLIGDPQRTYFPRGRFERLCEYCVPVTRELEDSEIKRASVWCAGCNRVADGSAPLQVQCDPA